MMVHQLTVVTVGTKRDLCTQASVTTWARTTGLLTVFAKTKVGVKHGVTSTGLTRKVAPCKVGKQSTDNVTTSVTTARTTCVNLII